MGSHILKTIKAGEDVTLEILVKSPAQK